MKRLLLVIFVVFLMAIFVACKEKEEQKKQQLYFDKYEIYSKADSTFTGLTVLVGEVDGHKMMYSFYTARNKSNLDVWHMKSECNKCIADSTTIDKK